ncbi:MAG: extracellular solute-binding protein [Oscillospiraceae bacterium]|nr:extracellular solute-binding protein [Oscillospiraceae bacterium]
MSKLKYSLGIILAVVLIAAGVVYIYFAHYAPLKPDEATEVTVWYVNNDKMWQNFAGLADNYSSGEGKKYGITVKVKAFDSRTELYKDLNKAIEEKGALPDMVVCDTDYAAYMADKGVLADLSSYFGNWEASSFSEEIAEASSKDGTLVAVPIAAETQVFMVNTKIFPDISALSSFEKLCSVADEYYLRNGSSFFTVSDYSFFFRTAAAQLNDDFDAVSPYDTNNKNCKYIYKLLAEAAYNRGFEASGEDAAKMVGEGKYACAIVSSPEVMRYAYAINADDIEFATYPCMKDGEPAYVEKVTGITMTASDSDSERASAMFIRWFTSAEVESAFVGDSGYILPTGAAVSVSDFDIYSELQTAMAERRNKSEHYTYEASAEYSVNSRNFDDILNTIMDSLN